MGTPYKGFCFVSEGTPGVSQVLKLKCFSSSTYDTEAYVRTALEGLEAAAHLYAKYGFERVETRQGDQWGIPLEEQRHVLSFADGESGVP